MYISEIAIPGLSLIDTVRVTLSPALTSPEEMLRVGAPAAAAGTAIPISKISTNIELNAFLKRSAPFLGSDACGQTHLPPELDTCSRLIIVYRGAIVKVLT